MTQKGLCRLNACNYTLSHMIVYHSLLAWLFMLLIRIHQKPHANWWWFFCKWAIYSYKSKELTEFLCQLPAISWTSLNILPPLVVSSSNFDMNISSMNWRLDLIADFRLSARYATEWITTAILWVEYWKLRVLLHHVEWVCRLEKYF